MASRTGATAIGMGMANTTAIVARHSGVTPSTYAAGMAASFYLGGKSDWFLPSKDELWQFHIQNRFFDGLAIGEYWSSSETFEFRALSLNGGSSEPQGNDSKGSEDHYVRPVRAF
jgi:hypothetical protein